MLPWSTKYGRLLNLIVSTTSGSAVWTSSRTSWQIDRCHLGSRSMYSSTRGSTTYFAVGTVTALGYSESTCITDNTFPAGSLNHAISGPPPRKIPFASVSVSDPE